MTTTDGGLAEFLADRYDEAEALAKAASNSIKGEWGPRLDEAFSGHLLDDAGEIVVYDEGAPSDWQFDHIAANDPAHRLADLALKRAILAYVWPIRHEEHDDSWYSCSQAVADGETEPGSGCVDENRAGKPCDCGNGVQARVIVRQLGTEFAGHPAYRSEWAP